MATVVGKMQGNLFTHPIGGSPRQGDCFSMKDVQIRFGPAEALYSSWSTPVCIISDGPYGVNGFPGDEQTPESLRDWYAPHFDAWSKAATPQTTLWFWNTEVGWANVHRLILDHGWEYRNCHIWDKGLSHVAGNANTQTLRKFPVVTEICVQYVKSAQFRIGGRTATMQEWLRHEWLRSGLPLRLANHACGVLNAATRKYLTADHLWYFPPADAFEKLAKFVNQHGQEAGKPYFSLDGRKPIPTKRWEQMRAKFYCEVGVTNVWCLPQVSGAQRIRGHRNGMRYKFRSLHGSQKPVELVDLCIRSCTDSQDVIWEPFGGLCPGAVVALQRNRQYFAAEIIPEFYLAAVQRLATYGQAIAH